MPFEARCEAHISLFSSHRSSLISAHGRAAGRVGAYGMPSFAQAPGQRGARSPSHPSSRSRDHRRDHWRLTAGPGEARRLRGRHPIDPRARQWIRLVASLAFVLLTVAAAILLGRRLTHASWPLDHAQPAACRRGRALLPCQLPVSRSWLAPALPAGRVSRPSPLPCLGRRGRGERGGASFRLDYLIKVGMLRKLGGIRVGFEAIALSIVSLGMIDAIAMLPLSISATATSGSALRGPLLIVVVFGIACCALLVVGGRLIRLPLLRRSRRLRTISEHVAQHTTTGGAATRPLPGSTSSPAGRRVPSAAPLCSPRSGSRSRRRPRCP